MTSERDKDFIIRIKQLLQDNNISQRELARRSWIRQQFDKDWMQMNPTRMHRIFRSELKYKVRLPEAHAMMKGLASLNVLTTMDEVMELLAIGNYSNIPKKEWQLNEILRVLMPRDIANIDTDLKFSEIKAMIDSRYNQ